MAFWLHHPLARRGRVISPRPHTHTTFPSRCAFERRRGTLLRAAATKQHAPIRTSLVTSSAPGRSRPSLASPIRCRPGLKGSSSVVHRGRGRPPTPAFSIARRASRLATPFWHPRGMAPGPRAEIVRRWSAASARPSRTIPYRPSAVVPLRPAQGPRQPEPGPAVARPSGVQTWLAAWPRTAGLCCLACTLACQQPFDVWDVSTSASLSWGRRSHAARTEHTSTSACDPASLIRSRSQHAPSSKHLGWTTHVC